MVTVGNRAHHINVLEILCKPKNYLKINILDCFSIRGPFMVIRALPREPTNIMNHERRWCNQPEPLGFGSLFCFKQRPPMGEAFFDPLLHSVVSRFVVAPAFREIGLRDVAISIVVAVKIAFPMSEVLRAFVVAIT